MADDQQPARLAWRDGTSQAGRLPPELEPGYAQVDERSTRDLLAFAKQYALELKYFSPDDPDRAQGDWSGFIGADAYLPDSSLAAAYLDAAADYAAAPGKFPPEKAAAYSRPHFALFLAFLKLLDNARTQLNSLTRRHLEFLYRDVLKMVRKRAVPDKVHVLVDLESGTSELALPAGTALRAGKDSQGKELVYRTDRELVASQVEIGQISSLHADMKTTGIREASPPHQKDGTKSDAFVAMLRIALGQPNPGDPLPVDLKATPPLYPGVPPANQPNPQVGSEALLQAQKLIGVVEDGLGMPAFDDLRTLMRLKKRRQDNDPAKLRQDNDAASWKEINRILEAAGKRRAATFTLDPQSSAFEANVQAALGKQLEHLFDGLSEVKTMEEAYAAYVDGLDDEKKDFLENAIAPLSLEEFKAMMQIKVLMDNQWDEINRLLEEAGKRKRKDPDFELPGAARASRNFVDKLAAAGLDFKYRTDFEFTGGLDKYFEAFLAVERYFYMSAENFKYLMSVAPRENVPLADEWAWDKVYEIVAAAHAEMIYARRRDALLRAAQPITDPVKALRDMLAVVLREDIKVEELRQRLEALDMPAKDRADLMDIAEKREAKPDWTAVARVLEIAQRNREGFEEPVPEKVEWRNLYPAADAAAVRAQPAAGTLARWKTFGQAKPVKEAPPPPNFGWALASPLLALSEGARTVTLTLGFSADPVHLDVEKILKLLAPSANAPSTATFNPFRVDVSTAKGWLEPESVAISWTPQSLGRPVMEHPVVPGVDTSKLRALTFTFTLGKTQPALAPLSRDVHGIDTPAPVLRLMMRPVWNEQDKCYVTSYQVLRNLLLMRTRLAVAAVGLVGLRLRNDQNLLDPKKPFEPFGVTPAAGSRLYIGHREIVAKKLDSLRFNIAWMGAPLDFAKHYANYPGGLNNTSFKARVVLSDAGVLKDFSGPLPLFDATDATKAVSVALTPPADQGNPDNAISASADVSDWNRYVVWELNSPDFQHSAYPMVALQKSLELAAAVSNATVSSTTAPATAPATSTTTTTKPAISAAAYQVNPPYTPKIKSLSLDYTASAEVALDPAGASAAAVRVFHVQPFGYSEMKPDGVPGCDFLPQYDFEGELYIGLRNVNPPQNVSLLFQVAEGSANPDLAPEPVQWSYLSDNGWVTLQDGSLLADATRGLINSGIVEIALKPAQAGTLLPNDLYWIRAAIARSADCVCDMVAIHPNAVLATFADEGNAPDHLGAPLPAESIKGPVAPVAGVARILQPYTSFGGKMAEQDASFYVRVSERLRHKQRALTAWDYERLVLEKFPQLYKVKCLPADPASHPRDPGRIELVVIPDIRNRLPFNPFEPKAPADVIRDVEAFLRDKLPPFASVKVKNARYVAVKVRCGVRFVAGADVGFCQRRLNDELNRFLSPWAYEEGADLVVGGSVYANSIIDFIDRRDYVDYVAEFKLFASEDGENFTFVLPPGADAADGYHVRPATPDAVLVAAREHQFDVISDADYRAADFTGVNYMKIELDFVVS